MPLTIEHLTNENVYMITMRGDLATIENDPAWEILQPQRESILIMDLREVPNSFDNIVQLLKWIREEVAEGSSNMSTTTAPIFIGSNALVETFIKKGLPQFYEVTQTPVFRSREEALAYVQRLRQNSPDQ